MLLVLIKFVIIIKRDRGGAEMLKMMYKLLEENSIFLHAAIPLEHCDIIRGYLLNDISKGTAVMFAIPYFTRSCECENRNISSYAVGQDYHLFAKQLEDRIIPRLKAEFPNNKFKLFADTSPINERKAAAYAGLGVIGKNGLLITERYSSYVFLGEIITDADVADITTDMTAECENCGACENACPYILHEINTCLSELTQKKGELTPAEQDIIKKHKSAWGCDICQQVCPHTKKALQSRSIYTEIDFFKQNPLPRLNSKDIENMPDSEFKSRAYSWRGRKTILRNLEIIGDNLKYDKPRKDSETEA